jgi:hypothetical protein
VALILDLSAKQHAELKARSEARGIPPEQYAVRVLDRDLFGHATRDRVSATNKARSFRAWAAGHRPTPPLSDAAISRESIYPNR